MSSYFNLHVNSHSVSYYPNHQIHEVIPYIA
jgi:hypothetical protein